MTNSKLMVINSTAVRIYEEPDKIFMEWFVSTDPERGGTFYKLDDPSEFSRMSLYIQNSALALQKEIDKKFYGKYQENSLHEINL